MSKVSVNESKLKQIIQESIEEVFNEIGNTPQGYLAIQNARQKSMESGRDKQYNKFSDYANNLDGNVIIRANENDIMWQSADKKSRVAIMGPNRSKSGLIELYNLNDNVWTSIGDVNKNNYNFAHRRELKVDAKNARRIAAWVSKYLPDAMNIWKDWHTYASL